jgi:hypothetical protein
MAGERDLPGGETADDTADFVRTGTGEVLLGRGRRTAGRRPGGSAFLGFFYGRRSYFYNIVIDSAPLLRGDGLRDDVLLDDRAAFHLFAYFVTEPGPNRFGQHAVI